MGVRFSNTVTATGSTPIVFRGTNLPTGLSVSTNGLISGTPTTAGTNTATLTASNTYGSTNQIVTFAIAKGTPVISNWPEASAIIYGQAVSNSILRGGVANPTGNFTWTTPTNRPNAGTNLQSVTFTPTTTSNYNSVTTNISLVVNKASPVLTWTPSPTAGMTYPAALSSTQLNATSSVDGTFSYNPTSGTVLNAGTSTLVATFTPTAAANYTSGGTITNTVVVSKATPVITSAPTASPIMAGQALSNSALSGGSASVPGTFAFASRALVPSAGYSSQPVIFTPTDSANYNSVPLTVQVTARVTPVLENVLYGTVAGLAGSPGSSDGLGASAKFSSPQAVATDASGNVYVADSGNHTIRKISLDGTVSTVAGMAGQSGSADGDGAAARFCGPKALAVGGDGAIYVADTENHLIRKISPAGAVTTLAGTAGLPGSQDGTGPSASFFRPLGITVDGSGNVYVADTGNHTLRKITAAGRVSRVAGQNRSGGFADGGPSVSRLNSPIGLAVAADGAIWVADSNNFLIRKLTGTTLSTVAGSPGQSGLVDGIGSAARLTGPTGLAVDFNGNLYFSEPISQVLRRCTPGGEVTLWSGVTGSSGVADGSYDEVKFYRPAGLALDPAGNLFVADMGNNTIRVGRVTAANPVLGRLQPRWVTESNLPVPVADLLLDGDLTGVTATASEGFQVRPTSDPGKWEVWSTGPIDYEGTLFVTFQVALSRAGGTPTTLSGLLVMQDDRNEDADGDGIPEWQEEAYKSLSLGLVAYYDGESLKDKTGNILDLSTKGGAAISNSLNGVAGRAFTLDGLNDGFILPDVEQLKFSSFSIGAWFYWEGQNGQVHQIIFRG
ncbi:MAG: hypothetical protein EBU36_05620, partial [Verrucomicrobia bacterium]|nr:hypothetical protein [Verrucomicrobiota bacterium]